MADLSSVSMKQNDRLPVLDAILQQGDPAYPIDLTGCTVKFIMRAKGNSDPKVSGACSIVDAAAGAVRYEWAAVDTDTIGSFEAEFEITTAGGKKLTVPNGPDSNNPTNLKYLKVKVLDDLG